MIDHDEGAAGLERREHRVVEQLRIGGPHELVGIVVIVLRRPDHVGLPGIANAEAGWHKIVTFGEMSSVVSVCISRDVGAVFLRILVRPDRVDVAGRPRDRRRRG